MALSLRLEEDNDAAVRREVERFLRESHVVVSGATVANALIREALDAREAVAKKKVSR